MTQVPVRRAIVEHLRREGVELIVGNPGSSEVPLLDTLVDYTSPAYLLVLHEAIAVAMADGYGRLTGRPAVVSVHATPGIANILGGLFLAKSHRSPVVVLAGQQDSRLLLRRPFLASDLVETVGQHVKWAWQVNRPDDVLPAVRRAFDLARQVPAGPVVVVIPRDLQDEDVTLPPSEPDRVPTLSGRSRPDPEDVRRAAAIIAVSRAPVILSGDGVGRAGAAAIPLVAALAELIGARVYSEHNVTTMHFSGAHPQYLGGNAHGTAAVREWLSAADVVVAIGCDLFMEDQYEPVPLIPAGCRLVQIDDDASEIGRSVPATAGVVGNLVGVLEELVPAVDAAMAEPERAAAPGRRAEVEAQRRTLDKLRGDLLQRDWDSRPIRMPRVYAELRQAMPSDAVMVDEAVNMASYLHDFFEFGEPGTLLSSKQSWLGWGLGAALGAQLARPGQRVVACLGDGSALYTIQALWTAAQYQIPATVVILNNGRYMAVENHLRTYGQRAAAEHRYIGTALGGIDFTGLARSFGVAAERVEAPEDLGPAFQRALNSKAPHLVEAMMDPNDAGFRREPIQRRAQA